MMRFIIAFVLIIAGLGIAAAAPSYYPRNLSAYDKNAPAHFESIGKIIAAAFDHNGQFQEAEAQRALATYKQTVQLPE